MSLIAEDFTYQLTVSIDNRKSDNTTRRSGHVVVDFSM